MSLLFESYQSVQNSFHTFRGVGGWRWQRYLKECCADFACLALLGEVFDHKSGTSTSKLHILVDNFAFMLLKSDSKSDRPSIRQSYIAPTRTTDPTSSFRVAPVAVGEVPHLQAKHPHWSERVTRLIMRQHYG